MLHIDRLNRIYPGAHFDLAVGCAEPGYDDKPVLLADWHHVPNVVFSRLESLGYACEWLDEWSTCSECGKAVRTSPDGYEWQAAYVIMHECELLCLECANPEEFYESIENRPDKAASNEFTYKYPIEDYGYTRVNDDAYINGFHGQNDDPQKILRDLLSNDPAGQYVFTLDYTSQFEVGFSVYRKEV